MAGEGGFHIQLKYIYINREYEFVYFCPNAKGADSFHHQLDSWQAKSQQISWNDNSALSIGRNSFEATI